MLLFELTVLLGDTGSFDVSPSMAQGSYKGLTGSSSSLKKDSMGWMASSVNVLVRMEVLLPDFVEPLALVLDARAPRC